MELRNDSSARGSKALFGSMIACLAVLVVHGCGLFQGSPSATMVADTSSQPSNVKTSIEPQAPPSPPSRPKLSVKENSSAPAKWPQTGEASWYGLKFHGKTTANGGSYDQKALTAAHASLPFGSKVKVTNLANGKSVEVEINDRGPFAEHRIIDVSRAAAQALDMKKSGTTTVRVELLADQ